MSGIARLTKQEVADSPRKGFWVHAGDLNQKIEQGQLREAALQQRLTAADERADTLEFALRTALDLTAATCTWQYGAFSWHTGCGQEWMLNEGTPEQNGMNFGHSCGKTLAVEGEGDDA